MVQADPAGTTDRSGLRFGVSAIGFDGLDALVARARWAEQAGFSTFSVSDHLNAPSPFVTLQAIAGATSTIRLGTLVVNNDLRHPVVLAQDAATVDHLSGGRLELGLGAGWAKPEYDRAGLEYRPAGERIDRLRETVLALRPLFRGELHSTDGPSLRLDHHFVVPSPAQGGDIPLAIGGNGDRLLTLAGEYADIVGFTGFGPDENGENVRRHFSRSGLADRVALVRGVADERGREPELNVLLQSLVITDDREFMARSIAQRRGDSIVNVLTCPFLAFGTVEEICLQLTRLRDELGITYVTVFDGSAEHTAEVMAALAGAPS